MRRVRRRGSGREAAQGREVAGGLYTLVRTPPLVGGSYTRPTRVCARFMLAQFKAYVWPVRGHAAH
jgi:hypothetical protein